MKRTALKRKTALAPGKPLQRKTSLARGTSELRRSPLKRGPWTRHKYERWTQAMSTAHGAWKKKIVARRCVVCLWDRLAADTAFGRDPHHILPARYIRGHVRGLKLAAADAQRLLIELLYDDRNGIPLCRSCHDRHENAFRRVPRAAIPARAWEFAEELGLAHVLDRLYPA